MNSRKVRVRFDQANAALTVVNSRYWARRMVYVLRADKPLKYKKGRSRIVYIGETRRGTKRPASSAASKALQAFRTLRGVRRIDVHPLTFRGKQNVKIWEVLERDLLTTFKALFGEIPQFNRQGTGRKFSVDRIRYFRKRRLQKIVVALSGC